MIQLASVFVRNTSCHLYLLLLLTLWLNARSAAAEPVATTASELKVKQLRCEYLIDPLGIDETAPRLSWVVASSVRGQRQTAYRVLVASDLEHLAQDQGDLWDSGKVASDQTVNVVYAGSALRSRQSCYWKVKAWDKEGQPTAWSETGKWSIGLLQAEDWQSQWISYRDSAPLHTDRGSLFLPPARYYRQTFETRGPVVRATVYATTLGCCELHINGQRIGDAWFTPGWSDYLQRVYYNTYDVTDTIRAGSNAVGAIVADGWYAGYVGYGLLVGYGPNKVGRYFYGKTPALRAQLEIEYADGSRQVIATDPSWQVTGNGPLRSADMLMGETLDARLVRDDWCMPDGAGDWQWQTAIRAADNGSTKAVFSDRMGDRKVELGFQPPPRTQAYSAPPIRITEELPALRISEPPAEPGKYIFDLGQNIAGVIRLRVKGPAGTKIQIRYGEMLHPDGRLMTENLRRARATDVYVLRGDPQGEQWTPQFTYHGFQYVELSGLPQRPDLSAVTGLVLHNDTPLVGTFACSDEVLTRFWKNTQWTQRANFVELPTDCPQRDERLGWMGDAQVYVRAASYNADVAAFFTKWLDDVEEAQRDFGAYPDYCPYPMAHGKPGKTFGTAWTDAGIICPWTIWQVYGDTRVIDRHWDSMTRFMQWRLESTADLRGVDIGNTWGDWLNVNETTPIVFIDACYHALDARLMAEMATATGRDALAETYRQRFVEIRSVFQQDYLQDDGTLKVDTQTAYVLALWIGLLPSSGTKAAADRLAAKIAANGYRMSTGFLGTKPLLPVLSEHGHHDLAVRLFQSRRFPSWGYEVINGATTVWERWDSYTKEDGFGRHNAAMNSFSHYSFGAVTEWMFRNLAGIDTDGPGFHKITIRPSPSAADSNPDQTPVDWVQADYRSVHGRIVSHWKREDGGFRLQVEIPTNTTATIHLPAKPDSAVQEGGRPLAEAEGIQIVEQRDDVLVLKADSGQYEFDVSSF